VRKEVSVSLVADGYDERCFVPVPFAWITTDPEKVPMSGVMVIEPGDLYRIIS